MSDLAAFLSFTPDERVAIRLSLEVAGAATLAGLPLAVFVAHRLARGGFVGKALLEALVRLPLVLPPVVTGFALLLAFGRQGPIGQALAPFGVVFAFDWTGAALAAGVMSFPLMVGAIRLGFEAVDPRIEDAAATMGAPPLATFFTVTLPLAAPGVLAGAVLGFAKALGEFGATITFVSAIPGETQTLSAAIYGALQAPGGETAALRLTAAAVALSLGAVLVAEALAALTPRATTRADGSRR